MFEPLINFLLLFREIPAEEVALITQHLQVRKVKEDELLLQEGKVAKEMFFICSGILKVVKVNEKGTEMAQFFLKENQFCTILNSFVNQVPSHESIKAACDATLIVLRRDLLWQLYEKLPYVKELIDQITRQTLLDKIELKNMYAGEDASTRYQKFLLRQPEIALRVSLTDIASYLNVTPQSLSRIRKQLR
jgi:CRP-like cAMP-binding protein